MRAGGFTVVEIAIVLFIMGLLTAMVAGVARSMSSLQRASLTSTRLAHAGVAITAFVQTRARLPCPADGALSETAPGAGNERRDDGLGGTGDCLDNQARGVVPWRSLGLSEADVTDGEGTRFTYRAAKGLTRDAAMSFKWCDAAGTAPAQTTPTPGVPGTNNVGPPPYQACASSCRHSDLATCTGLASILAGRGLEVRDANNVPQTTAAAYVLVSHGNNRAGGYAAGSGVLMATLGDSGPGEAQNAAPAPLAAFYVDSALDATPATYFDDLVRRPGILAVVSAAGRAPER